MSRALVSLLFALAWASTLRAQTDETLRRAVGLYENLRFELAKDMLLQVISPSSPFDVSREQRVTAYKYLGAAWAELGKRDSAVRYFTAALDRDPFVDLDPLKFAEQDRQAFARAKSGIFRVAVAPVNPARFDPRSQQMTFHVLSTHRGEVIVELRSLQEDLSVTLFKDDNEGLRDIPWNGSLPRGGLAPSGTYDVLIIGRSRLNQRVDSGSARFDLTQDLPALEDTLRSLSAAELLPERRPASVGTRELLAGLGLASAAIAIPVVIGNSVLDENQNRVLPAAVAGAGVLAGVFSFAMRSRNPVIPANVAENTRRQTRRDSLNAAIVARNNDKIAKTQIVISPQSGASR